MDEWFYLVLARLCAVLVMLCGAFLFVSRQNQHRMEITLQIEEESPVKSVKNY